MSLLLMHLIVLVPLIISILFYVLVTAICHEYVYLFILIILWLLYKREKKSMLDYNTQNKTIES